MMPRLCKSTVKLLLLFCLSAGLLPDLVHGQDQMYWTNATNADTGTIERANLDGSDVEVLVTGLSGPRYVMLDLGHGKMYWTDGRLSFDQPFISKIQRANLDGSDAEELVSGFFGHNGLALDVEGGKMYWTWTGIDFFAGKIQRANLDGSDAEDLVTKQPIGLVIGDSIGLGLPQGIVLNTATGMMYWGTGVQIQRANFDGSNFEILLTDQASPQGLALDVAASKMYWTNILIGVGTGKIQRANLDGSDVEELVTDLRFPGGIVLDVANDKMYWTDRRFDGFSGKIQRANLDGSDVEDLVTGLSNPLGLALTVDNSLPSAVDEPVELPAAYTLSAPYPNPFNAQTTFTLSVEQPQHVHVALYDARGRRLATLHDGRVQAHQRYTFSIAGDEWASGLYFYEVVGEYFQASRSVALLK